MFPPWRRIPSNPIQSNATYSISLNENNDHHNDDDDDDDYDDDDDDDDDDDLPE